MIKILGSKKRVTKKNYQGNNYTLDLTRTVEQIGASCLPLITHKGEEDIRPTWEWVNLKWDFSKGSPVDMANLWDQICGNLGCSRSHVTEILNYFVKMGLITRLPTRSYTWMLNAERIKRGDIEHVHEPMRKSNWET